MNPRAQHAGSCGVIRISMSILVIVSVLLTPGSALALDGELLSVSELLETGGRLDSVEITVEGELVGDHGFRDDGFMWTQINDDSYARAELVNGGPCTGVNVGIGIRMPSILGEGSPSGRRVPIGGPARATHRHLAQPRSGSRRRDVSGCDCARCRRGWASPRGGARLGGVDSLPPALDRLACLVATMSTRRGRRIEGVEMTDVPWGRLRVDLASVLGAHLGAIPCGCSRAWAYAQSWSLEWCW